MEVDLDALRREGQAMRRDAINAKNVSNVSNVKNAGSSTSPEDSTDSPPTFPIATVTEIATVNVTIHTPGVHPMKVAVLNYSGSVGKTIVASHLLAPRMNHALIFAVETTNETAADLGLNIDQLRGEQFGKLFRVPFRPARRHR